MAKIRTYPKELTLSVQEVGDFLKTWKIEADIRRLKSELSSMGLALSFNDEIVKINKAIAEFSKEITAKNDLNYKINFSSLKQLINTINLMRTSILKFKTKYPSSFDNNMFSTLTKEKFLLELAKKRGEKIWIEYCNEYALLEKQTIGLARIRNAAFQAKNIYAKGILHKYESEVNNILNSLQADFKLVDTKPKEGVRSNAPLFGICFGNHKISLSGGHDNISCFGNTLSESDKRLLAFAFFLASLKVKGNIKNKIIVFDDPLSSLDNERKFLTVNLIKEFIETQKPLQIIILTHEKPFLSKLIEDIPSPKCFKIVYYPNLTSSKIEIMNPNEEFLETYYRQLEELRALGLAPDTELNWEKLRPMRDILEQLFKKKYYFRLTQEIKNKGSVSSFVKKLINDKLYKTKTRQKIESIVAHFWNHDDSERIVKRDEYSPGDIRGIIKNFFQVIEII